MKAINVELDDLTQLNQILNKIAIYNNASNIERVIIGKDSIFYKKADPAPFDIVTAPTISFEPLKIDTWDSDTIRDYVYTTLYAAQGLDAQDMLHMIESVGPEAAMTLLIMSSGMAETDTPSDDLVMEPGDKTATLPYGFTDAEKIEGEYTPKEYIMVYNPTTLSVKLLLKYGK